jgi:hypothetical protein
MVLLNSNKRYVNFYSNPVDSIVLAIADQKVIGYYTLLGQPYIQNNRSYYYYIHYLPDGSTLFSNSESYCQEILNNTHMLHSVDEQNLE